MSSISGREMLDSDQSSEHSRQNDNNGRRRQYFTAFAVSMTAFSVGTALGWSSPALQSFEGENSNNTNIFISNGTEKSFVASIVSIGASVMCPFGGYLMETIGCKGTIMYMLLPYLGGWLLIAFAQNLTMLLSGRFITGACIGSFTMAAPVYLAENSDVAIRGLLGSSTQFMITTGILFMYAVGTVAQWNTLSLMCGGIATLSFSFILFIPESPIYLLENDEPEKATKSHVYFKGKSEASIHEFEKMQAKVEAIKMKRLSDKSTSVFKKSKRLLSDPSILKPTAVCVGLMFFQQATGINVIIFNTAEIFSDAGLSKTFYGELSAVVIGIVQVLAMIPSSLLVDTLGRKILLIISGTTITLTLVAIGIFFYVKTQYPDYAEEKLSWLPFTALILFFIAFSVGYGPIPMTMTGELAPPDAKGFTSAISLGSNWLFVFAVTQWFVAMKSAIGLPWCYFSFAIITAVGVFFVIFAVPETKRKSLDEIHEIFAVENRNKEDDVGEMPLGRIIRISSESDVGFNEILPSPWGIHFSSRVID